ncbi:Uncharacterized membrane protein YsdA, DUF1294 family [Chryseobacterium taihuense]|uniref:Uncharacterized membrane protein YsdA, DUF1294 family n=2 Tax=Chryseobacterium taihuense TaxID=1141221 RepID=A0ABY0QTN3_9FLAO|nr:Uncharacterized membrane protein YsdA, DUF1294 family [Chryseobacterium taihuense]
MVFNHKGSFRLCIFAAMIYYVSVISLISFGLFGLDKMKAVKRRRRISENTLLAATLLGGTIGTLLGMIVFRHKISKKSFLFKTVFVMAVQIMAVVAYNKFHCC